MNYVRAVDMKLEALSEDEQKQLEAEEAADTAEEQSTEQTNVEQQTNQQ